MPETIQTGNRYIRMKNRKKLWISLVSLMAAILLYRLARLYVAETTGVVLIGISAVFFLIALVVFAIYFKE